MLKRLGIWYRKLTLIKQTGISFFITWMLWFAGSLLEDRVFYNGQHSLIYHIFSATWMACLLTVLLDWKNVKALFRRKAASHATKDMSH